jgi:uncharacterized protein (UPF0147 family)
MWARWVTRRSVSIGSFRHFNVEEVKEQIALAVQALNRISTIRRSHTTAKKEIERAGHQLASMAEEVISALDELEGSLMDGVN